MDAEPAQTRTRRAAASHRSLIHPGTLDSDVREVQGGVRFYVNRFLDLPPRIALTCPGVHATPLRGHDDIRILKRRQRRRCGSLLFTPCTPSLLGHHEHQPPIQHLWTLGAQLFYADDQPTLPMCVPSFPVADVADLELAPPKPAWLQELCICG